MRLTKKIRLVFFGFCGIYAICVIAVNIVDWYRVEEKCIANYGPCKNSIKPCCRQRQLENPCDMPEDFICNQLNGGICEPLSKIRSLDEYIKLTKNLHSIDISNRTDLYREILGLSTMDSTVFYVIYFYAGCLMFLLVMIIGCHVRLATNYVPIRTDDVPTWN